MVLTRLKDKGHSTDKAWKGQREPRGEHTKQLLSGFFPFNCARSLLLHYCVFIKKTYWNVLLDLPRPNYQHDFSKSALSELLRETAVICLLLERLPTKLTVLTQNIKGTGKNQYISNRNQALLVQLNQLEFGTVANNAQAKNCLLLPSKYSRYPTEHFQVTYTFQSTIN